MTGRSPVTARLDDEGRRLYTWTGRGRVESFYSVTTIIGLAVPKHALIPWTAKTIAELAYRDVAMPLGLRGRRRGARALGMWAQLGRAWVKEIQAGGGLTSIKLAKLTDEELALRWLKGETERVRDEAATRGSDVHAAAEDLVLEHVKEATKDGELIRLILDGKRLPAWPDAIRPWMENGFVPWVRAFRPRIVATEATVYNRSQAYAGTADTFLEALIDELGWLRLCVDYKSSKAIYPEVAMQCEAYARGEFLGGADLKTEFPVPAVDGTAVLHLTAKGYEFTRLRHDDAIWTAFLYVREVFRWVIETSKSAIGDQLLPDVEDALVASLEEVPA